jgi:hypothetical protein
MSRFARLTDRFLRKMEKHAPPVAFPIAFFLFVAAFLSLTLAGQEAGPIPGPPPQYEPVQPENPPPLKSPTAKRSEDAPPTPKAPAADDRQSSGITKGPPSIPVDQIIQQFAAREAELKTERENFTYVQTFVLQTIGPDDEPDGEYRMTSDITFTPAGKRYEVVTNAPPPTLERVSLSEQDLDDLRNVQPFVLTTDELPKYDVTYFGREQIDEITAYVFDVAPKKIEKNKRYFQGRVWVDDKDLEIVKTYGKAVPDIRKGGTENVFPRFETYRENIEGRFWFPTYTRADDVLHFRSDAVRIHMTVRYSDYRRFRVSMRLVPTLQNPPPNAQPPPQNP